MDVEHQQGTWTQLKLFEAETGDVRHGASGDGGTEAAVSEEEQASTALNRERGLTSKLMERIGERENLNRAYKRVKGNKGAPGVDGMTVTRGHRKEAPCHRCWRIYYWMTWTRNWNAGGTAFADMRTTATSTYGRKRQGSG